MSSPSTQAVGYRFDDIYIDARNRQLWRNGALFPLNSKYFDVLLLLLRQRGSLVEKQRIFEEVWEGVFVTDAALTQCIKDIRKQLGDDASNPRYIKTVPKHGYIFISSTVEAVLDTTVASPASPQITTPPRPYKFLDYYSEQDAPLFFGRESEVEAICSRILSHRAFILHGRSGVGKSSIVRAGLTPRLKAEGHRVFVIRCFTDPIRSMASAIVGLPGIDGVGESEARLKDLLEQASKCSPNTSFIFLLDQFEEFFSSLSEESRQRFIAATGEVLADEALPIHLVFVLREDLLAEMSQFKTAIPDIYHHEYRLKRFSREQAALAISEPARVVRCQIESQLLTRLLDDLSDEGGIEPPQLQIVCDSLYDARHSDGRITTTLYEQLGGTRQILAGYLERVLSRLNARDLQLAKEILQTLISADGNRRILRLSDLEVRVKNRAPTGSFSVERLVGDLISSRIVRSRSQDGEVWLELAHDVLVPEISCWLTVEERSLKEARAVIERAMENYRAHQLMPDAETLAFVLRSGEQLGLTGEEADLLTLSSLNRNRRVPDWLAQMAPSSQSLVTRASRHEDANVRTTAIEASRSLGDQERKNLLRNLALEDRVLGVRRAATLALADWLNAAAAELFIEASHSEKTARIRSALSLAILRDHDRRLVRFSQLSISLSTPVAMALLWLRLRGEGFEILRRGFGGTLGGAASGFIGSLMLGTALMLARREGLQQAAPLIFVLCILGAFVGGLGALGVSFGMVTAARISQRRSRWWSIAGGVAGGALIGGTTKLLGIDALKALFGQNLTGITGAFEGAVIGAGVSLGVALTAKWMKRLHSWNQVLGGALGAMSAAILLSAIGGNLFSGSLDILARAFADSQIRMDPLAYFFGEVHFGRTTQITLGAIEGMLFGGGTVAGIELFSRAARAVSKPS